MTYTRTVPIEFNHCDPAGIVFYPRYFEMTNSVVENFFPDEVGHSFAPHDGRTRQACPRRGSRRISSRRRGWATGWTSRLT